MAGNFFDSAEHSSCYLEDNGTFHAKIQSNSGEMRDSKIDLNGCIGNENGQFVWGGCNYQESGQEFDVYVEGGDSVCILRGKLWTQDGQLVDSNINLAERLANEDGSLRFLSVDRA